MRIEGVETTRWETSDNQTSDIRHQTSDIRHQTSDFRLQTSDNQTDSVACGVYSTDGRWYGGGRFLVYARNDRGGRDLSFEN